VHVRERRGPVAAARYRRPHADPRAAPFPRDCPMLTVLLLCLSNVFMTFAWYGHLKYGHDWPLWQAILVSWGIAFLEYCLAVPANRYGYGAFSGFQLKIVQEVITLAVFVVFALLFLQERPAWNHVVAFLLLAGAAFFAFGFKPGAPA
jgi:uncharacterized protein (DUF486 family)